MTIELDEIDRNYIRDVLAKCRGILEMRMSDPDVCEKNRDRSREYAKMVKQAIDILNVT